jgi:amino acid adenylation domain-containing protein
MTTSTGQRPPRTAVQDAYPLSRLQAGMIYHAELAGDASYYHDIYSLRVRGPWVEDAFRAALNGVVAAHDTLRTSCDLTGFSEPLQLVHTVVEPPIEVIDLRDREPGSAEEIMANWRRAETGRPFDLGHPPLFRVVVHLLAGDQFHFWWSFHHAIMDGWSLHSAVAELFAGYTALRQGRTPDVSVPKTRYRNYIALELEALDDPAQQAFWRGELDGAEPGTLPTPPRSSGSGATVGVEWHDVPAPVMSSLNQLAAQLAVPVRSVLLAAHLRVTAALLGRSDPITGVIGNGRPETNDAEQVKGLFLCTFPFRLELKSVSWASLVASVFAKEVAILPHRRYPLAAMVAETGWSPFDIVFDFRWFRSYQELSGHDDLEFDLGAYYEHTNYPLTAGFVLSPDASSLRLQFRYDTRRFDAEDIARVGRAYLATLARMAADPEAPVWQEPALAAADLDLVAAHARGPVRTLDGAGLYERLERSARLSQPALSTVDGELTRGELFDLAGRIGGYLTEAGVRAGDPVGVCLQRGKWLVPALVAILRIGAHYVPLDPDYPLDRLRYIARHCGTALVLHDDASTAVAVELEPRGLRVEDAVRHESPAPVVPVGPDDLAYTIYTSGSTGQPKGVQVRHGAVVNLLDSLIERLDLVEDFTYLATTSISFDIHVNEIFVPLLLGATVLVAGRDQVSDGQALRELIDGTPELVAQGPPAMWRMLLDTGWRPDGMARILCGGEAFPRDLALRLIAAGIPVWNMYGPTETTVWSATHLVGGSGAIVPIGRPLNNTTFWVLDAHLQPVFPGVPGELFIGGEGVASAYHNRPDLTADRFVPDPFSHRQGARLYRTGDLVRLSADGRFEFLERVDLQVKVRGYRIELEEIEARLAAHPEVSMAVVAAPMATDGERVLAAYVVGPGLDGTRLREWCAQSLPAYMVPQAWVFLDCLPTTPNGKVDRKALPSLDQAGTAVGPSDAVPSTETERRVAAIWARVLGLTSVSVDANFFDIGGHSLRALRIVLEVRDEFGFHVPVGALIQASTVRRFAAMIDQDEAGATRTVLVPLNREGNPRLFLFHPLGGHVFVYAPLARALDGQVSVYGVRASGMEPGEPLIDTMNALVDRYLADLRAIQPEGPYHLAGWCMGATIAMETARRLRAEGERVDLLGLIVADPFDPEPRRLLNDPTSLVMHAIGRGAPLAYEEVAAIEGVDQQVDYVFNVSGGGQREDVANRDDAHRLLRVYQANATAIGVRAVGVYDGEAEVFVLPAEHPSPPDMGWRRVVRGRTHIHDLPGTTANFLDSDQVGSLAKIIGDQVVQATQLARGT